MEAYQLLEQEFGAWAKVENVVAVSSGSAALHVGLETLRLPPGSQVLCPDLTMVACPRAITMAGLVPVFVDCGDDLLMDLDNLDEACSDAERPAAILAVHIYGRAMPMSALAMLARKYNLAVVEDIAEAHGLRPHPDTDAAAWSFYRNKCIAGEEGGAVAFRDPSHAALARELRSLGFTDAHDFMHTPRGHNYRLANALASLVLASLAKVDANIFLRRQIEATCNYYCPSEWQMPPRDAVWIYDLRVPGMKGPQQDRIVRALNAAGIAARHCFKPMREQQEWKGVRECRGCSTGKVEVLSREVIYLPLSLDMTEAKVQLAFDVIRREIEK